MREVTFYKAASGQNPIDDFLDTLSSKQAQKVTWVLNLLEELNRPPSQYFKKLTNTEDLWEVRVKVGSNIFRFVGFFDGSDRFVLAHAFQKKTQKTPMQAIKVAEKRKQTYFKRRGRKNE